LFLKSVRARQLSGRRDPLFFAGILSSALIYMNLARYFFL